MKTAIEIVREYLVTNGFDGLCDPNHECGCILSDLQPCGEDFSRCVLGYAKSASEESGYDYLVTPERKQP